jgi:hypothetical protein
MEIGRKYNFGKEFRVVKVDHRTIRAYFIKNLGNGTSLDIILEKKLKPVEFFCTKKYWKNSFFPEFCELDDEVCSTIDEARCIELLREKIEEFEKLEISNLEAKKKKSNLLKDDFEFFDPIETNYEKDKLSENEEANLENV